MKCDCGATLTPWDREREYVECVRCYLRKMGAIKSSTTT